MTLIEQAIFTSAHTDRSAGYQLVARSPGVGEADARELAVWCPSHGSLVESGPDAASFNFHPLPSGACCASRTAAAGAEYSGRGGQRIYTHCLIVRPEGLARFANNPFALLRAALAGGHLQVYDEVPTRLEALALAGRAAAVDTALLARLATNPGVPWLATLVQAALDAAPLAIVGGPPAVHLIAGLINCLPPECRTEFSFSTGLKLSSQRPFRVMGLAADAAGQRRLRRKHNLAVLDLDAPPPDEFAPIDGWSQFVRRVLESGRTALLAAQFSKRRFELRLEDLPALGLQLLEEMDATALRDGRPKKQSGEGPHRSRPPAEPAPWDRPVPGSPQDPETLTRAHAPHRQFGRGREPAGAAKPRANAPSQQLDPDSPEVLERLEQLDDVVFEAISGSTTSLEQLETLWPQVRAELGDDLVSESREQYLRYALSIWEECLGPDGVRNPAHAAAALDVLCVLFDE
jgi:hypothetical protein